MNQRDYAVKQALERLAQPAEDKPKDGPDLRWAHRIMKRWASGEPVNSAPLNMARQALADHGITYQREGGYADN